MATLDLPTYIPLSEAARRYRLGRQALTRMVESGRIRAVRTPEGGILVASEDVTVVTKDQFRYLQGEDISLQGASRKYEVPASTLHSWIRQGHIKVLASSERKRGRALALDEQDVAYCAALYHRLKEERGSVSGMRIFAAR